MTSREIFELVHDIFIVEEVEYRQEYNDRTGYEKEVKLVKKTNIVGGMLAIAKSINNLAEAVRELDPQRQD